MSGIDTILSDGREISEDEVELLQKEVSTDCFSIETENYYLCANPQDADYKTIPDRQCNGEVAVDSEQLICGRCARKITDPYGKETFEKKRLFIDKPAIRDEIRKGIRSEFNTNAPTILRKYFDHEFPFVLDVKSPDVNVFVVFDKLNPLLLKWCKVYNESPVFALVGDSAQISGQLSELRIPSFSFSDLLSGDFVEALSNGECGPLADRELRADLSHNLCSRYENLERMNYDDFERCVQNLLMGILSTSSLLGSTEAGSGVPDGLLTVNHSNPPKLYMWDAKFVDYTSGSRSKTTLKSEYDKIFRHRTSVESVPSIDEEFEAVEGIILFTPGIKEANISRLAEFIRENDFIHDTTWNGFVCYFHFDALLKLYDSYSSNESDVQNKYRGMNAALHKYLTSPSKHDSDSDTIANAERCLEMTEDDIENMFKEIGNLGSERKEVPAEDYLSYLNMVSE